MSTFNCYLFGRFRAHCNQQLVTSFHSQKALELLCFLLLNRDRPYHREILAEVLWGDNRDRSKTYLRKTIWQLQKSLSAVPDLVEDSLLQVDPEWLQIKTEADIWTDAGAFEAAYTSVLEIYGQQFHEQQFAELQSIVGLYQGDLLEGWYEDWCVFERERFKEMYLVMIDKLMECCEAHHKYELAIVYGKEILRHDQARERTHRRLMRLYYLKGDRTGALRQFRQCRETLKDELDVEPSQRTLSLLKRIENDKYDDSSLGAIRNDRGMQTSQGQIADSLKLVSKLLSDQSSNQEQISEEFNKLERALRDLL